MNRYDFVLIGIVFGVLGVIWAFFYFGSNYPSQFGLVWPFLIVGIMLYALWHYRNSLSEPSPDS